MPSIKKIVPISFEVIDRKKALSAIDIHACLTNDSEDRIRSGIAKSECLTRLMDFKKTYGHPYTDTLIDIWRWHLYIFTEERNYYSFEVYDNYLACISRVRSEPMKLRKYVRESTGPWYFEGKYEWVFNGFIYEVNGFYTDNEIRLLILEDFDKERRHFEKLKLKFDEAQTAESTYERPRIPESVRIEVWRRDGGKCARCGSREKLEYDHIVPISKGGSDTARNIELLCEKCNRSKSNNVV